MDKIKKQLGLYIYGAYNYNATTDIAPAYYIGRKEVCSISNLDELKNKRDIILDSEFSKNIVINNKISIPCIENTSTSLLITPMGMHLSGYNDDSEEKNFSLLYFSSVDSFFFEGKEKNVTADEVYKLFNLNFDHSYFSDYHRLF